MFQCYKPVKRDKTVVSENQHFRGASVAGEGTVGNPVELGWGSKDLCATMPLPRLTDPPTKQMQSTQFWDYLKYVNMSL